MINDKYCSNQLLVIFLLNAIFFGKGQKGYFIANYSRKWETKACLDQEVPKRTVCGTGIKSKVIDV